MEERKRFNVTMSQSSTLPFQVTNKENLKYSHTTFSLLNFQAIGNLSYTQVSSVAFKSQVANM